MFFHKRGIGAVFRVIPRRIPTLDELDLPPAVRNFTRLANGLVLVTGPTGSGKTTTLAAIIDEINRTYQRHIITIEDPIEFIHEPIQSLVTQRQVGTHVEPSRARCARRCARRPDVLVVGRAARPRDRRPRAVGRGDGRAGVRHPAHELRRQVPMSFAAVVALLALGPGCVCCSPGGFPGRWPMPRRSRSRRRSAPPR